MSNTNDFTPFATGAGANVLAPATWAADPAHAAGFQSGTASSAKVNTSIRQAGFVAAMIAQFTADFGPSNVQDNGNLAQLESQFEAALNKYLGTYFVPVVPATTWYVDFTNGTDAPGQGLSSGTGAFASLPYAVTTIKVYFSASVVTIRIAAGTFNVQAHTYAATIGSSLISSWALIGAGAGTTIFACANNSGTRGIVSGNNQTVSVTGISVTQPYYDAYAATSGSGLTVFNCNVQGGTSGLSIGFGSYVGSSLLVYGSVTASGTFLNVFSNQASMNVGYNDANTSEPLTVTFSGSVTVTGAVAACEQGFMDVYVGYVSFAGTTPSGQRYNAAFGGFIQATGGGANLFPGTSAGSPTINTLGSSGGYYAG